jgi:hypothetical protein
VWDLWERLQMESLPMTMDPMQKEAVSGVAAGRSMQRDHKISRR